MSITFRILLFKSLSQVATMKALCCVTLDTRQSSAYVPLCMHGNRSNLWNIKMIVAKMTSNSYLGSLTILRAILCLEPSFSNSAITQSVM